MQNYVGEKLKQIGKKIAINYRNRYVVNGLGAQKNWKIRQSHDFCRACSLFVARVASFAPKRNKGANDSTRATNKLYARQKSCNYHYYQYTRPNHTNSFNKNKMFNRDVA